METGDPILNYAIEYKHNSTYPSSLTKDKKRAVRKQAKTLSKMGISTYNIRIEEKAYSLSFP